MRQIPRRLKHHTTTKEVTIAQVAVLTESQVAQIYGTSVQLLGPYGLNYVLPFRDFMGSTLSDHFFDGFLNFIIIIVNIHLIVLKQFILK
jgi:hypothetical protein